jgi:dihydroorotase-like cyclic amidohydrolase
MREEKEHLRHRVERSARRLDRLPDFSALVEVARQVRLAQERGQELHFQRAEEKQAVRHIYFFFSYWLLFLSVIKMYYFPAFKNE